MKTIISKDVEVAENIEVEIKRAADLVGRLYDVEKSEVSITLTDDATIHKLNKKYRNIDRATDVLSFALRESDEPEILDAEVETLGDIIISVERAKAQAEEFGHTFLREVIFLEVHGLLHLLGYDHIEDEDRVEMEGEQKFIMERLGILRDAAAEKVSDAPFKSGFIAVIGRPNVGKSTLINKIIGQKIAITSNKPQTTRSRIQCILTESDAQFIFLDTPGIHKPKFKLGEYMLKAAGGTLKEVDAIFFVIDATEKFGGGEKYILERLSTTTKPVILVVNKIDLIDREKVLPIIADYQTRYNFAAIVPISAADGSNIDDLLAEAKKYLPEGIPYYPADMVTDQPERLIVAEIVREKILHVTEDEVPHSVAVDIEEFSVRKNKTVYIRAVIYVERDSQKGILIGKGGGLLKTVGQNARPEIEMLLGGKVFLDLWVKVKRGWRNSDGAIQDFGFGGK